MDKFPHYPDNGPPIPDGVVIIRFLQDPRIVADRVLVSTGVRVTDPRPRIEAPFATHIVEETNLLPFYISMRYWDSEGEHWVIEKFRFDNVLDIERICNSVEYGKALRAWEDANPGSDWRSWLPSAKRPSARMVQ